MLRVYAAVIAYEIPLEFTCCFYNLVGCFFPSPLPTFTPLYNIANRIIFLSIIVFISNHWSNKWQNDWRNRHHKSSQPQFFQVHSHPSFSYSPFVSLSLSGSLRFPRQMLPTAYLTPLFKGFLRSLSETSYHSFNVDSDLGALWGSRRDEEGIKYTAAALVIKRQRSGKQVGDKQVTLMVWYCNLARL